MNPVHSHQISLIFILILSSNLRLHFRSGLFALNFPIKIFYSFLISITRTTCPVHLILLDLIAVITVQIQHTHTEVSWLNNDCQRTKTQTKQLFRIKTKWSVLGGPAGRGWWVGRNVLHPISRLWNGAPHCRSNFSGLVSQYSSSSLIRDANPITYTETCVLFGALGIVRTVKLRRLGQRS
jgi:hypothetical protein